MRIRLRLASVAAAITTLSVVPVLLWIGFYVLIDFGTGYVELIMQAWVSRDAPQQVSATMMAALKASAVLGYFLHDWFDRLYEPPALHAAGLLHARWSPLMLLLDAPGSWVCWEGPSRRWRPLRIVRGGVSVTGLQP